MSIALDAITKRVFLVEELGSPRRELEHRVIGRQHVNAVENVPDYDILPTTMKGAYIANNVDPATHVIIQREVDLNSVYIKQMKETFGDRFDF